MGLTPPPRKCWERYCHRMLFQSHLASKCACSRGSAPDPLRTNAYLSSGSATPEWYGHCHTCGTTPAFVSTTVPGNPPLIYWSYGTHNTPHACYVVFKLYRNIPVNYVFCKSGLIYYCNLGPWLHVNTKQQAKDSTFSEPPLSYQLHLMMPRDKRN